MVWAVYAVSMFLVVMGAVWVLYTNWIRKLGRGILRAQKLRFLAPIPLGVGVLLILSTGWSEVFWFVLVLGAIAVAKGLYLLFGPKGQVEAVTRWALDRASDQLYRLSGVIWIVLGMTLLSWIR